MSLRIETAITRDSIAIKRQKDNLQNNGYTRVTMNNYYELNPPMYSSNSTYSGLYNETHALDTNSNLKNKTIQIQEELVKEMNEDFDIAYEERPELKQVQTLLEDYRKINDKYMKDVET